MFESRRTLLAVTVVLTAVFAGASWWAGGLQGDGLALELVLIAANTLPLLLLGWNPVVVVLVFAVAYPTLLVTGHEGHILQSLPSLAALYAAGEWDRPLWLRAVALLSPVWMFGAAVSGWWGVVDPLEIGYVAIVFGFVWALGVLMAARRAHVTELEEKTARLEEAERELAERAVAEERARIARELHDVVAHSMSVITVQAGVGSHLIEASPGQAAEALSVIERTGREALEEMRRLLAVLQGSTSNGQSPDPQPGLADVSRLVEQVRSAGVVVTFREEGESAVASPGLHLAAYRVIQEALTNVVKHAGGSPAEVTVRHRPGTLAVEVRNRGPVAAGFDPGQGLRGMAERVALYDGRFEGGPDEEGFRVLAVFPTGDRE